MASDRRTFLKQTAAAVAVTATAGCALREAAARTLDPSLLSALGEVVLPESLGAAARARAVAAFREWIAGYEPVSEEMHSYGDADLRYSPADPAPGWGAQLAELDLLARRRHRRTFAALDLAARRSLVTAQLERVRGDRLPANALTAPHVAVALLAHWAASSEATDLVYQARIGKGTCRALADSPRKPLPIARSGTS